MKRILVALGFVMGLAMIPSGAYAQYKQGDNLLNIGFGLNSYYSGGLPFCLSFEHGITREISAGGMLDYFSYRYAYAGNNYGFSALYIGARGSYHFNEVFDINDKSWDIYGGLSLGYRSFAWHDNNGTFNGLSGVYGSGLFLGVHAGAKYYFNPKVGAFFELGALGSSNARLGIAFKF
jgi:hypothetical protein